MELLLLKKEHIENLITLARGIQLSGANNMDFKAFDTSKIDEYSRQAKEAWGKTEAYKEFEEKEKGRSNVESKALGEQIMELMKEFGSFRNRAAQEEQVQALVRKLQEFITEHYYTCTKEILSGLGHMYADGGDFTKNMDAAGGVGTAAFANEAIQIYCTKKNKESEAVL